jgi:YbgC/YbaW family acyl-CoA thioester hydrolase
MIELPFQDLVDRVFVSRERVRFSDADPYGHLSSGAYVDLVLGHRVQVLGDTAGLDFLRMASRGIGFPVRSISVTYRRPSFVGDRLEVGSWLETLETDRFLVRIVVAGEEDRKVRASAEVSFAVVDMASGRPVPTPAALESSLERNSVVELPRSADFLGTLNGTPPF